MCAYVYMLLLLLLLLLLSLLLLVLLLLLLLVLLVLVFDFNAEVRPISEISSCFFGPRTWHIEIRHRVKKTPTINLFGFETLKLKIIILKLWKPTVVAAARQLFDKIFAIRDK